MDQKTIIVFASGAAVIILAAAFYYFTKPGQEAPVQTPAQTAEVSTYGTDNPLQKKPDLNPVEKANPFTNIKTNPFE